MTAPPICTKVKSIENKFRKRLSNEQKISDLRGPRLVRPVLVLSAQRKVVAGGSASVSQRTRLLASSAAASTDTATVTGPSWRHRGWSRHKQRG